MRGPIRDKWGSAPLGQFLTFQRGFDITKAEQQPGPYEVISSSGPGSMHSEFKVKGPGVVIGRKGTLGTVFFSETDFWPHDTTLWVKDFHGNDEKFAYYFLQTLGLQRYDCGASNPTINRNHIHTLPVRFPPLSTQRKIAEKLSAYDELIENNTRRIKILEEMAQAIYREWFVHFRFPGHEGAAALGFQDYSLPHGWRLSPVAELSAIKSGFAFKSEILQKEGTFGLVTIKNVHDGLFVEECQSRVNELPPKLPDYCFLQTGDILLSLTGNVGRVCLVHGSDLLLNQRVAKLVPNETRNRAYTYFMLRESAFRKRLESIANGVAQQNLSPVETARMEVPMPPQDLRTRFSDLAEPLVDGMLNLFRRNSNLRKTRDILLPKLMSGEVDFAGLGINKGERL